MNRIQFPIENEARGPRVTDLHDGLLMILERGVLRIDASEAAAIAERLRAERADAFYGAETHKAVSIFQDRRELEASGIVDEATAEALNRDLEELGAFNDTLPPGTGRLVAGIVRSEDGTPVARRLVRAFHVRDSGFLRLGEDETDVEGRYTIRYMPPPGAPAVDLGVAVLDGDGEVLARSDVRRTESSIEFVNVTLSLQPTTYAARGAVASLWSASVGGLRVGVYDCGVGPDMKLAEAQTDAVGEYRVTFTDEPARAKGKRHLDLRARVLAEDDRVLAESAIRYDASPEETLDVWLPNAASASLAPEHATLHAALSPYIPNRLADLEESGGQQDITYLANKTGWDARAIAMAAMAEQRSVASGEGGGATIPPALFYALFRAGVPAEPTALYATPASTAERVWKEATARGVIAALPEAELAAASARFAELAADQLLSGAPRIGLSSFKDVISLSVAEPERQRQLAELHVRHANDMPVFWKEVVELLGETTARRLKVDALLAGLTLNNSPLIRRVHEMEGELTDVSDVVVRRLYDADEWRPLVASEPVPGEIARGAANTAAAEDLYAQVLAAEVRLSFPTAVVAEMVRRNETPLEARADAGVRDAVHAFLVKHDPRAEPDDTASPQGFRIDAEPIAQYVKRTRIETETPVQVLAEIARIQRVRQITQDDVAMNALLGRDKLDSARAIAVRDVDVFVREMAPDVGGEAAARTIHARAREVHTAVLNIAMSYAIASRMPGVGVHSPARIIRPEPNPNASDVIAYPTLESLMGEMDYCECEHCRSILSPAAYLVDLLLFLDRSEEDWEEKLQDWPAAHGGAPYPYATLPAWEAYAADFRTENNDANPPEITLTPLQVLLERRPDLEHLPLTCENTNRREPAIDLVNHLMEYYITEIPGDAGEPAKPPLSLVDYESGNTDAKSEELLAHPASVREEAYEILAGRAAGAVGGRPLPPAAPLPLHLPLERLRRYARAFGSPLAHMMRDLRVGDDLVVPAGTTAYGWHDILLEELEVSRPELAWIAERARNADDTTDVVGTVRRLFGFTRTDGEPEMRAELTKAKSLARRLDITYQELIDIVQTRFVNPNAQLIPKLARLSVSYATIKRLKAGEPGADAELAEEVADDIDQAQYGNDIRGWLTDDANYARIMRLIALVDRDADSGACSFDDVELRYANPDAAANQLAMFDFIRVGRFVRIWRKLGWSIELTDQAIATLYPADQRPDDASETVNLTRLDEGSVRLMARLGAVRHVMDELHLKPERDLSALLGCFAPMNTHGASLYRRLFQSPAFLRQYPAFASDEYGNVLADNAKTVAGEAPALRAACSLTAMQFDDAIAGLPANAPLTLENVSLVFRRGWLARTLKMSVRELLLLAECTGIDPFAPPDPPEPPIWRFIELIEQLRERSFSPAEALDIVWDRRAPSAAQTDDDIHALARALRGSFVSIEQELSASDDPDGALVRSRLAALCGDPAAELYLSLLEGTFASATTYIHPGSELSSATINASGGRLAYDAFGRRLKFAGELADVTVAAVKAAAEMPDAFADEAARNEFKAAVDRLQASNRASLAPLLSHPELQIVWYTDLRESGDPLRDRLARLLDHVTDALKHARTDRAGLQAVAGAVSVSVELANALLSGSAVLHAHADAAAPALTDFTAVAASGLSAQFTYGDPPAPLDSGRTVEPTLDYGSGMQLPTNPAGGDQISGVWDGYVEPAETGRYQFRIMARAAAAVSLDIDGVAVNFAGGAGEWISVADLELRAAQLYRLRVDVRDVEGVFRVEWRVGSRGWVAIPSARLYAASQIENLRRTSRRVQKAAALVSVLRLSPEEFSHLASSADLAVGGVAWLHTLAIAGDPLPASPSDVYKGFQLMLDFARMRTVLSFRDGRLVAVLRGISGATQAVGDNLIAALGWDPTAAAAMLGRFGKRRDELANVETLVRVHDALAWMAKLGVRAQTLIDSVTNEPSPAVVDTFEAALRGRYDRESWLTLVRPINDELRGLRRDALVAYILHQMQLDTDSRHIDTPDKLFEYFLTDPMIEPCSETSRIRHALSAVQLFIERCLMNLEPRVAASALDAKQWEWKKRYRVWEANRKVYLFPENWLEPELRDGQSPFFKEALSELLQGDITDEAAESALLGYLTKLEEVAKLEPCGMHYETLGTGDETDDIVHVVARTAGANRKYYYRRREPSGWTPWEHIRLEIEDNPVIPVVWRNRRFLFWLRIVMKSVEQPAPKVTGTERLDEIPASNVLTGSKPTARVEAILCWSEYLNGKWQPARTSDLSAPLCLNDKYESGGTAYPRSELKLIAAEEAEAGVPTQLRVGVVRNDGALGSFRLYNANNAVQDTPLWASGSRRDLDVAGVTGSGTIRPTVYLFEGGHAPGTSLELFRTSLDAQLVDVNVPGPAWYAPFLYADARRAFYVTSKPLTPFALLANVIVVMTPPSVMALAIPPLVLTPTIPWTIGGSLPGVPSVTPPRPEELMLSRRILRALPDEMSVTYADRAIGIAASQPINGRIG